MLLNALEYHEEPSCEGNLQKRPLLHAPYNIHVFHTTGLMSCYFVKTILSTQLKKIGYNHKPRFTFEEVVNLGNDGRKNKMNHNIIKIGNSGMICLACSHNFAFVSTLGPIPEVTSAVRIMSAPPHQSQQSGPHYNHTNTNGCMFNVSGVGTLNNLQIMSNNSHQQPVNEPAATARGGIGEKFPDANNDDTSSCIDTLQFTIRASLVSTQSDS